MHVTYQELHLRETRLREELQSQEAEISRLREELSKCHGLQEGAKVSINTQHVPNIMSTLCVLL